MERHLELTCVGRVQACARHAWTRAGHMAAREASRRSLAGACRLRWRRFHRQMVDRPERSPKWLPVCRFGAWKLVFWDSNRAAALERVNSVAGFFSGAWRRVTSALEFFPPYNDRSEDDLSVGGGLGPSRFLERRFWRKWWLGCAWWRVGRPAEYSNGAREHVKALMTTISQGFVDQATIYPMVKVVA